MANIIVITPTGGSAINLTDGFTLGTQGKYVLDNVRQGRQVYERQRNPVPGGAGQDTKLFGFRSQLLTFSAVYVHSSAANLTSAIDTDNTAVNAVLSTITYGGITWTYCECIRFEMVGRGVMPAVGSNVHAVIEMAFESLE